MIRIPLQAVPNQTLAVTVASQSAQLALRQNGNALYFDLISNGVSIVRTRICRDRQRLLLNMQYRGFVGDFALVDTRGTLDSQYWGLGSRFQLYYIGANE